MDVLSTIKRMLGIDPSETNFDQELEVHINSAIFSLAQITEIIGSTPKISGNETSWDEILPGVEALGSLQLYIYYKVRLSFDPPTVGSLVDAFERQIKELEFRISILVKEGV